MTSERASEERERIARIIDPSSWRVMDAELARVNRIPNAGYDPDNFKHQGSLAKADAILAILTSRPDEGEPVAWDREAVLRELIGIINPTAINEGYRRNAETDEAWAARRTKQINVALAKAETIWDRFLSHPPRSDEGRRDEQAYRA